MQASGIKRPEILLKESRTFASYAKRSALKGDGDKAFVWARASVRLAVEALAIKQARGSQIS